jgi:anaerobic selenocysteine-containing dehydrogenase
MVPQREVSPDRFLVVTRRGKQFNSMVQADIDPTNLAPRDGILMNPEDMGRLGMRAGQAVELVNEHGVFRGRVFPAPVAPGTLQVYWPEGNVLVDPASRSPLAKIPAYKEVVATVRPAAETVTRAPSG